MDAEQAQRFLRAAQRDYDNAVRRYVEGIEEHGDSLVWWPTDARQELRAARQVLELAQQEVRSAGECEQAGRDLGGICAQCGDVGPRWVWQGERLCRSCATRAGWRW
jgi:hypothetical protein